MFSKLSSPWVFLMVVCLVFTSVACDNEDDPLPSTDKTIVEVAAEDAQFSILVSLLQRTGLDDVLANTSANYTVFAPTNDAFAGVDADALTDDELSAILLYHVLGGEVLSSQIVEGKTYVGTASTTGPDGTALSALISRSGTNIMINNSATVTGADIDAVNGVIHVIDKMLTPLDIVGHVVANDDFSSLAATLGVAAGQLTTVLGATDQVFTVFAPVNQAFTDIESTTTTLSPEQLASVLTYHVVAGLNVLSSTLTDGQVVPTVQTETFTVNINAAGEVTITDATGATANVIFTDVQATNGVVHVLDKVILPVDL